MFNPKSSQRDQLTQSLRKDKGYQPYFMTENVLSNRQPEKKIKLNMNFNINPTVDSKNDRGAKNSSEQFKNSMKKFDYNYNLVNNNYLN